MGLFFRYGVVVTGGDGRMVISQMHTAKLGAIKTKSDDLLDSPRLLRAIVQPRTFYISYGLPFVIESTID
jgi:hypothetical protein